MVFFTRLQLYRAMNDVDPASCFDFLKNFILGEAGISECAPHIEKDLNNCFHLFLNKITERKSKLRKSSDEFVEKTMS